MQQIDALQGVAGFATDPDTADFKNLRGIFMGKIQLSMKLC